MPARAVRVIVTGRVQGIGYRAFVEDRAMARGISGWVRNLRDGSVEAVFSGNADEVDQMIAACRKGPYAARVAEVKVADYLGMPLTRFTVLPTA